MATLSLIGLGDAARYIFLPALHDLRAQLRLVGIAAVRPRTAGEIADILGPAHAVPYFDAWPRLLRQAAADIVVVATPDATHFEIGQACLRAGSHVVVEKPAVTSVPQAASLLAASQTAGRDVWVNMTLRYMPVVKRLRQAVAARGGPRRIEVAYFATRPQQPWYGDPALAGPGVGCSLGIHALDLACFVADARQPVVRQRVQPPQGDGVPTVVVLQASAGACEHVHIQTGWTTGASRQRIEVACERGACVLEFDPALRRWRMAVDGQASEGDLVAEYRQATALHRLAGGPPPVSLAEHVDILRPLLRALEEARP